jgi:prepilin-type N-terminal cleavage/methylation domain-containing protein
MGSHQVRISDPGLVGKSMEERRAREWMGDGSKSMRTKQVRGFSMMELVVVLAVIAILATLITPIITSYVDKAKITKAQGDVRNLATALNQFSSDTRSFPIFTAASEVAINGTVHDVLASEGLDPAQANGITGWVGAGVSTGSLKSLMNENSLQFTTSGRAGWNGPYTGTLGEDPWGSKYLITARALKPGSNLTGFVLSAGPNRTIETALDQTRGTAFTIGGDDVVSVVR